MKAEVWCKPNYRNTPPDETPRSLKVWKGHIPCIPRIGEYVVVFDGWASARVEDVHYFLYAEEPYVMIEIGPDTTGEYQQKIKDSQ